MVPLNDKEFMIDLIKKIDAQTILVIQNYLGSINHSLLSIEALISRNINILGVIINGAPERASEDIILNYSGLKCLGRIGKEEKFSKEVILKYAKLFTNI